MDITQHIPDSVTGLGHSLVTIGIAGAAFWLLVHADLHRY